MKQSVCLSMICRDEAKVMRRCLDSVRPLVSSWVICDNGSTDGTQDIVADAMAGVPGELIQTWPAKAPPRWQFWREKPFFDFAKERNAALDHARATGAEYVLVIDADEEVRLDAGADGTFPALTDDRYCATFRMIPDGRVWHRALLVKTTSPWSYRYPIHEVLCSDDEEQKSGILGGLEVWSYSDGGRNVDQKTKFLRDARILERVIAEDPTVPRHWFYLGQSYAGAGSLVKALRAYEKRVTLEGWDEERWQALYQQAPIKGLLGYHWRDVLAVYLDAFNKRPWRAEPLWAAGKLCMHNGEAALGEVYLRAASQIPLPCDSLLVDETIYAWRSADDLAGCLAILGRKKDCIRILERLRDSSDVPDAEKPRIIENLELAEAA